MQTVHSMQVVMSPIKDADSFCAHYMKLLPDSDAGELQKVLEMKVGV